MAALTPFPKLTKYRTAEALRARWAELGWDIPCDDEIQTASQGSPLATPLDVCGKTLSNRWCIHPMEGWDGTTQGEPTDWTRRRWESFGRSGAKLIWGGEAVAVQPQGRANPNQLMLNEQTQATISDLRDRLIHAHREDVGETRDLLIGLQLTHSGRFARPNSNKKLEPRIAYHHPLLDQKFGIDPQDDRAVLTDNELYDLMDDYVRCARLAAAIGFDFVDLKCCHGYLGHELLSARVRLGPFGGSFENRTRFIRELIQRVQSEVPSLGIGVRVSAFDILPFEDDPATRVGRHKGKGVPMSTERAMPYEYGFGVSRDDPLQPDLAEARRFLELLESLDVRLVNISCGSPYYNPHIQRPAAYPPSDGYQPPEDPLVGVARQIDIVRQLKASFPNLVLVGSGYSYLQEFLPHVAQAVIRQGWVDVVGLGRMVLSYPELPLDALRRGELAVKRICRTFSDCTTGPRIGLRSGCYPLDTAYKNSEEAADLKRYKRSLDAV